MNDLNDIAEVRRSGGVHPGIGFLRALDAIYSAAGTPTSWPDALDAIAKCFDAAGTVMMWQKSDGSMKTIVSPALASAARDYEEVGWKLDFVTHRGIERHIEYERAAYTDRHLASESEIATHPFYTAFRAKHGLGPFMASFVSPPPALSVVVSLQGAITRNAFTDDELLAFESLARHVERALLLTVRLLESSAVEFALTEALDKLSCGVFVLDAPGNVIFSNQRGIDIVGGDIAILEGRFSVSGPSRDFVQQTMDLLASEPWHSDCPRAVVVKGCDGQRVMLHIAPIPASSVAQEVFVSARILVMAIGQAADQPADASLVRDFLGLTLGEARLASLIGSGQSPREAASSLGISEEAATNILLRIFDKTGISRQSELAAILARVTVAADPSATLSEDDIRTVFQLTPAEAKLVSALVSGQTLEQFASDAGIAKNTARNQLASVFSKTRTNRQAELVGRVISVLAALPRCGRSM